VVGYGASKVLDCWHRRGLVDATDFPFASADCVVRTILVDPGAEPGRAHREGHDSAFDQGGPDAARCKPKAEGSEWP
jgi:hypothetical protein